MKKTNYKQKLHENHVCINKLYDKSYVYKQKLHDKSYVYKLSIRKKNTKINYVK